MARLSVGSVFAGYRIDEKVGQGGMGVVYRATQLALDRPVALKVIAPELSDDQGFRARFQRESRLAASIQHPHVISIHDAQDLDGTLFLVMDYIQGTDLSETLRREGALAPARAARIVHQVGSALDAAHALGLVHRDIKPANVLLESRHGSEHAYLTDFGLTTLAGSDSGFTQPGQWVGTLDYVSPEQIQGHAIDFRADVYALGCMLYETLTGRPPYERDTEVAKMWAHMNDPPPVLTAAVDRAGVPLNKVVARAMAKEPEQRHASAGEAGRAALRAAATEEDGRAGASSPLVMPAFSGPDETALRGEAPPGPRIEASDGEGDPPSRQASPEPRALVPEVNRQSETLHGLPKGAAGGTAAAGRKPLVLAGAATLALVTLVVAGLLLRSVMGLEAPRMSPERAAESAARSATDASGMVYSPKVQVSCRQTASEWRCEVQDPTRPSCRATVAVEGGAALTSGGPEVRQLKRAPSRCISLPSQ